MTANWETAAWTFWALLVLGGGIGLATGHYPAGIVALAGGMGGIGYLARSGRQPMRDRGDRRHVPAPKGSRKGAKAQSRKAA
jgi:hypothetical protein